MKCSAVLVLFLASAALAQDPVLPQEALDRVMAATVFIRCTYAETSAPDSPVGVVASGSGFIVSDAGLVITNHHVVASTLVQRGRRYVLRDIAVHVNCGTKHRKEYTAVILAAYELPVDLALLRIRADAKLPALETNSAWIGAHDLALTERTWAIGFPLGDSMEEALAAVDMTKNPNGPDISVREGSVTALRKDADGKVKAVEHSCNIEHGNSGGPLVNRKGLVVGVNALGIEKTAFAIPLWLVQERFGRTMAWVGESNVVDGASRRVLRVDPSAEASALSFHGIDAAFAAARAGDTVELAEGSFELKGPLRIPGRVWVRGAGKDKTTISSSVRGGLVLEVGSGGDYSELSDMRIESMMGTAVAVRETATPETYLHDLAVWGVTDKTLLIESGGSPNVAACSISGGVLVRGPAGRSRFSRSELPNFRLQGGRADIEGCASIGFVSIDAEDAELTVTGSNISAGNLKNTRAALQGCTLRNIEVMTQRRFEVTGTSSLEVSDCSAAFGFLLDGSGVEGSFSGTRFSSETSSSLFVTNGASAQLRSCVFGMTRGARVLSQNEARATNFGIGVRGAACRVKLSGCAFETELGGVAIRLHEGASVDAGDSTYSGVSTEIGEG